eukprot:5555437-Pleurochrysis_carterae.AAC.2
MTGLDPRPHAYAPSCRPSPPCQHWPPVSLRRGRHSQTAVAEPTPSSPRSRVSVASAEAVD